MKTFNVLLLKKEVENVFGRKILSTSDCQLLMDDFFKFTNQRLSLNTLRRLFNLMKSEHQPSINTLDILSTYCGFSSYSDFMIQKENSPYTYQYEDAIFLNILIDVFNEIEFTGENESHIMKLMNKLVNSLIYSPKLIDRFQRAIAKTKNGQKFYFETFINYDNLSRFYGRGLNYYIKENNSIEAQLFGNSLLCLNSWLVLDNDGVNKYFSKLSEIDPEKLRDPYLKGRYFASLLLEADSNDRDINQILISAKNIYLNTNTDELKSVNPYRFEFVMAETLVLIYKYEEAFFYINKALNKSHNYLPKGNKKNFESLAEFLLLKAIVLAGLGSNNLSKQILQKIKTQDFYFLSKEFYSILYFSLLQIFQRKKIVEKQINHLIEQTGFKKLQLISQNILQRKKEDGQKWAGYSIYSELI